MSTAPDNSFALRAASRTLAFACALLGPACRAPNPEFLENTPDTRPDPSQESGPFDDVSTTQEDSISSSSSPNPGATEPSQSLAKPPAMGQTTLSLPGDSISQTLSDPDTGTQTGSIGLGYGDFCEASVLFCAPVLKDSGFVDPKLSYNLRLAGLREGTHPDLDPLAQALYTPQQGPGFSNREPYSHQGAQLAVDLWFLPDETAGSNWTIFELEGVLAIHQVSPDSVICRIHGGEAGVVTLARSIRFKRIESNGQAQREEFAHVACGVDAQGKPALSVDGSQEGEQEDPEDEQQFSLQLELNVPLSFKLGRGSTLTAASGKFSGRIASLRIWNDHQRMVSRTRQELDYLCSRGACANEGD